MRYIILLVMIAPFWVFSQDYIQLTSGEAFNCKIITVNKQEVVLLKDSIYKKVPAYMVSKIKYNTSLTEDVFKPLNDSTIDLQDAMINPNDTLKYNDLYLAGYYKKQALNLKLIAFGVSIGGGSVIGVTASIPLVSFTIGIIATLYIFSEVYEYKSANSLMKAGIELKAKKSY